MNTKDKVPQEKRFSPDDSIVHIAAQVGRAHTQRRERAAAILNAALPAIEADIRKRLLGDGVEAAAERKYPMGSAMHPLVRKKVQDEIRRDLEAALDSAKVGK